MRTLKSCRLAGTNVSLAGSPYTNANKHGLAMLGKKKQIEITVRPKLGNPVQ